MISRNNRNRRPHFANLPTPAPFGAYVTDDGVTFTLFSRNATRAWLMLFNNPDDEKPSREIELNPRDHRIGDVWHVHLPGACAGMFYAYRLDGETPEGIENTFNPTQWLLDPYTLAIAGSPKWGDKRGLKAGERAVSGSAFPKGVILQDDFDWQGDRPINLPIRDCVFYETHVRGYTAHESSGVKNPGTYKGLIEKIPFIKSLGITSVELLPIHEFNEMEYYVDNDPRVHQRNFWGYSTLAFFAPMGRFAASGVCGEQVREFKEMVKAFHDAGLEVILDVVYNHTVEGGRGGPLYSFRGIQNDVYYMLERDGTNYRNYSGCGNTVNCNHPVVADFILHSLRYWVQEMHIDGFRFDLASILTRGTKGEVLSRYSLVERIADDPVLRDTKLIAEAWDAAGLYQVGNFPDARWAEWNGRYRDDVRAFWKGEHRMLRTLATRLVGSPDLYEKDEQTPQKTVNFVTCHDGFTLCDIVSYNKKDNLANGEDNRDGENHNHSFNYGEEGPTTDPEILAIRMRQMKNLIATTLFSQGVPMLLAGDEFARTQKGNNNAYCQDNDISWVDWSLAKEHSDLVKFVKDAIAFRQAHPALRQTAFLHARSENGELPPIRWFGRARGEPHWDEDKAVGLLIHGDRKTIGTDKDDADIFIIFNADERSAMYHLPDARGRRWVLELSTEDRKSSYNPGNKLIRVQGRSLNVLVSGPKRRR